MNFLQVLADKEHFIIMDNGRMAGWLLYPDQRSSERTQYSVLAVLYWEFKIVLFEMKKIVRNIVWFSKGDRRRREFTGTRYKEVRLEWGGGKHKPGAQSGTDTARIRAGWNW